MTASVFTVLCKHCRYYSQSFFKNKCYAVMFGVQVYFCFERERERERESVYVCVCACMCVYTGIVRNELICGHANVVNTLSLFHTHTHTHALYHLRTVN